MTVFDFWKITMETLHVNKNLHMKLYDELVIAYTYENRYYHNLIHIEKMLNFLNSLFNIYRFDINEKIACFLATFYHDIVYRTKTPDHTNIQSDEMLSAMCAIDSLSTLNIDNNLIQMISELIKLTHDHIPNENLKINLLLQKIFIDADMSILAATPEEYTEYSNAIEKEYNFLDKETFIIGRKNFLFKLLKNNSIFLTDYMNSLYDTIAKKNINNEINHLNELYVNLLTGE